MLVPFYFLTLVWGGPESAARRSLKLFIYTLVGSLLMLVGAIATGVLAAERAAAESRSCSATCAANLVSTGSQDWIFLVFARGVPDQDAVVPVPRLDARRVHADADRRCWPSSPAILSKVAAYGFLRIALPLFPARRGEVPGAAAARARSRRSSTARRWRSRRRQARLVLGYSSVAQLGFIVLGIFSLNARGADGALLQSVNHALVAGAADLRRRAAGRARRRQRGHPRHGRHRDAARRRSPRSSSSSRSRCSRCPAPSNFVGEFIILLGVFQAKIAIAIIASVGVAMAAVYALRLYIRAMHNRVGPLVQARELTVRDGLVLVPMLLAVVALALYPQFALKRGEHAVAGSLRGGEAVAEAAAGRRGDPGVQGRRAMSPLLAVARAQAPHIDWAGLSPLLALLGGATVVLLAGLHPRTRSAPSPRPVPQRRLVRRRDRLRDLAVGRARRR